eukprot:7179828-Ditylum_brightwellii.AAC.1
MGKQKNYKSIEFTTKFDKEGDVKSQQEHINASNKETFLSRYDGDKPNIDEQQKTMVASFLNNNKMMIKSHPNVGEDAKAAK